MKHRPQALRLDEDRRERMLCQRTRPVRRAEWESRRPKGCTASRARPSSQRAPSKEERGVRPPRVRHRHRRPEDPTTAASPAGPAAWVARMQQRTGRRASAARTVGHGCPDMTVLIGRPCGHFVRSTGPTHPLDQNIQTATTARPGSATIASSRTWSTARVHDVRLLRFDGGRTVASPRTGQGRPRGVRSPGWRSCGHSRTNTCSRSGVLPCARPLVALASDRS